MDSTTVLGLIGITFCICIFLAWYFTHKAKHQERLLMIEKGMNPNEELNKESGIKSTMFKLGIVIIGLGIGLAIIAILVELHSLGRSNATPMSILGICGGAALVIANRLSSSKK
ncbi:DUF6249 domain-containing protein [Mucilaginibacter psychrotolerans]|uniref:DUF6249 domain-containing protein n=1 Tax=Mucilaginibacter psychrotolerans TaxID=1524096 RepID=A0A4Y8S5S4_9SPHI|nr:DUF6249 domain-containing protein [Mucilaginibacter psychrotolerans]TFF33981.1 hypothetical protein E2R66_23670 [Mucilaginibacter psychrotolerans]